MRINRYAVVAMLGVVLLASGCRQEKVAAHKYSPAKLEESGQEGIMKVVLDKKAAERIGLRTVAVSLEKLTLRGKSWSGSVVPYGALMYDNKGNAWTFTNPEPLVFVRHPVIVEDVDGDRVILAEGPPPGTLIVSVGAAELLGAEHKYGSH